MSKEIMEKVESICSLRKKAEEELREAFALSGSGTISCDIPMALADIIKDLAAAEESIANACLAKVEMKYKETVTEAMEEYGGEEKSGYSRYMPYDDGYNRGHVMGYNGNIRIHEAPRNLSPGYDTRAGYDERPGRNDRPGYDHDNGSGRGMRYDEYRRMRRSYTESQTPENQKAMDDSREKLFDDIEGMIMEAWPDMQPAHKQKYLQKGSKLMQKLQQM